MKNCLLVLSLTHILDRLWAVPQFTHTQTAKPPLRNITQLYLDLDPQNSGINERKVLFWPTYHRVLKDLPQVTVSVRGVIVSGGYQSSKLLAVCNVHENPLQRPRKTTLGSKANTGRQYKAMETELLRYKKVEGAHNL